MKYLLFMFIMIGDKPPTVMEFNSKAACEAAGRAIDNVVFVPNKSGVNPRAFSRWVCVAK